jgi:hypothetical protein
MSEEIQIRVTPRAQRALDELQAMISAKFPRATFEIQTGHDPAGIYLLATVDIEDPDEVMSIYSNRLVDIQVYDEIPVYVVPLRPVARVAAELREEQARAFPPLSATG